MTRVGFAAIPVPGAGRRPPRERARGRRAEGGRGPVSVRPAAPASSAPSAALSGAAQARTRIRVSGVVPGGGAEPADPRGADAECPLPTTI
jgi:hypothetical protein